ncbi:[protein-PII] uridylyltransferase [Thiolapillus brandeum]|uniref:Bifunctional uridylyltransferase/uridylyl-removing enzyme n=1 Tax=Thiolapillus brandeum TaxID=1076588 RepID=A0A7U6JH93_9GAMM|nr:[protein-PII] uridylyltransferase [Thiolapillus brandeum]BAO44076.1 [protein-PII] uridylyltransferase [Thiolapillus brandeum]
MPLSLLPGLDAQLTTSRAPLEDFRRTIKASKAHLAERFAAGDDVEELVHARSHFIDQILIRVWRQFFREGEAAALVAVGGYGRGELHPASDVDVLILVENPPEDEAAEKLERLVTFLWDIGLEIGHSVRTLKQCVEAALGDVTIVTNLMESRFLVGEESLFLQMREATGSDRIWPSDEFFSAKCEEQKARHARFGDTAYNLEPNIKSNPGGLRDIQMIGWVVKRHFHAERLSELLHQGFLTDAEYQALKSGQKHLWKIRFALHILTGRHEDRLLFEHQRAIAHQFGYSDEDSNLAVEQFMQDYYRTVMELNRLNEMLLQLFQEAILYENQPCDTARINNRFQSYNGYLEVSNNAIFARYPIAILELFLILQEHPELEGVRASTIRLIRAHLHLIDDRYRKDIRARSLFLEILRQPTGITHVLRRMHRYGVLAAYIPAFANITGRMQFDLFHVYTVDEHTLMLLRNLRRFSVPEFEHEFPLCSQVFQKLVKPELLYIAGLFHDIAKGRGGDHALLGAVDAREFCILHDLSDYDASLVAWLVSKHLLMSMTAQHKDIEDPLVVQEFAAEVGDRSRLDYLYLLTVADIRATNPKRWTSWKSSLLNRLYYSTRQALLRGLQSPMGQDELIQSKQTEARRLLAAQGFNLESINQLWSELSLEYFLQHDPEEIAWHGGLVLSTDDFETPRVALRKSIPRGCDEIFIIQKDRKNQFAQCTALMDQLHLNILEARIRTTDGGVALNSFFVLEVDGSHIAPDRAEDIQQVLEARLGETPSHSPKTRPLPRRLQQFTSKSEISITQDEVNRHTLLHIKSMDRPGLLSLIAWVLAEQNLRLFSAKVTTMGALADDVFTLTDTQGRALEDPASQERLVTALLERLE